MSKNEFQAGSNWNNFIPGGRILYECRSIQDMKYSWRRGKPRNLPSQFPSVTHRPLLAKWVVAGNKKGSHYWAGKSPSSMTKPGSRAAYLMSRAKVTGGRNNTLWYICRRGPFRGVAAGAATADGAAGLTHALLKAEYFHHMRLKIIELTQAGLVDSVVSTAGLATENAAGQAV